MSNINSWFHGDDIREWQHTLFENLSMYLSQIKDQIKSIKLTIKDLEGALISNKGLKGSALVTGHQVVSYSTHSDKFILSKKPYACFMKFNHILNGPSRFNHEGLVDSQQGKEILINLCKKAGYKDARWINYNALLQERLDELKNKLNTLIKLESNYVEEPLPLSNLDIKVEVPMAKPVVVEPERKYVEETRVRTPPKPKPKRDNMVKPRVYEIIKLNTKDPDFIDSCINLIEKSGEHKSKTRLNMNRVMDAINKDGSMDKNTAKVYILYLMRLGSSRSVIKSKLEGRIIL